MAAYQEAVAAGFGAIVGIRDVFPEFSYRDIPSLRRGLRLYLKTNPLEVKLILGVMEIETWFIAEHTHLQKIDPILTPDLIKARLGFDPSIDDIQLRPHPTEDLGNIYRLAGMEYTKNRRTIHRTVRLLDYERLYLGLPSRIPDLKTLVDVINQFLTS